MTAAALSRTRDQRMQSLKYGNDIRLALRRAISTYRANIETARSAFQVPDGVQAAA